MFGADAMRPIRMLMVRPRPRLVAAAVRQGFDVWAVVDPELYEPDHLRQLGSDATHLLAVPADDEAALDVLVVRTVRRNQIEHVVCPCGRDHGLRRKTMVLPGPHSAVRLLNDPFDMRRTLGRAGAPGRPGVADSIAEIRAVLADLGYPAVVRGRSAVLTLTGPDDVEKWARHHPDGPYLIGEPLTGPQFVVTTLTFEGMHHVVGVTARTPECLTHPAELPDQDEAAIRAVVTSLLDLAGYERGPAHTTVVLTVRGPRIDSVHTWFGHEALLSLLELCTGLDVEAELVRWLTDGRISSPSASRCAAVRYLRPGPGHLVSIAGQAELSALPGVRQVRLPFVPGDVLTSEDTGFFLVEGATVAEARARACSVHEKARVVVEGAW
ncbi:hypothetical protein [Lentzea sp. HUAS12]|uniref:hypothetical protein n=1 Tax=Lentzea sp. HUAS12 TaxID=2951806 RepID=UPI00209F4694|nr:hypothetical protein [Lentzea sp. HUAS12]USX56587.1 hypothetical protein ND450_04680 [Lentzea sp. HUAS12]